MNWLLVLAVGLAVAATPSRSAAEEEQRRSRQHQRRDVLDDERYKPGKHIDTENFYVYIAVHVRLFPLYRDYQLVVSEGAKRVDKEKREMVSARARVLFGLAAV